MHRNTTQLLYIVVAFVCLAFPLSTFADSITIDVSAPGPNQVITGVTGATDWQFISPTEVAIKGGCTQSSTEFFGFIPGSTSLSCWDSGLIGATSGTVNVLVPGTVDPATGIGQIEGTLSYAETLTNTVTDCASLGIIPVETCYTSYFQYTAVFALADGTGTGVTSTVDGFGVQFGVTETPAQTPEPSSLMLLGAGLFSCIGPLRRKRMAPQQ